MLRRNGVDVEWATAEAKKWKAGQVQSPALIRPPAQPTQATKASSAAPIPSAPSMTATDATKLALALAGDNGMVAKIEATYRYQRENIPIDEVRAHARRVAP
jgi:hypothetical protein